MFVGYDIDYDEVEKAEPASPYKHVKITELRGRLAIVELATGEPIQYVYPSGRDPRVHADRLAKQWDEITVGGNSLRAT